MVEEIDLPEEFAKITKWHGNVLAGEGRTSFLGSEFSPPIFQIAHTILDEYIAIFKFEMRESPY